MFPPVEYVEWIRPRIRTAEHDLGSSDLSPESTDSSDGRVVPERLRDVETPARGLEALVADAHGVLPSQVLVTAGASSANLLAVATALTAHEERAGDEADGRVLVEKPGYEPHVAVPRGLGGIVDRFIRPREEGWPLVPDRIENAVMDETTLVTVSNRHNPSGVATDQETVAACASAAASVGATLHVDEVYGPYGRGEPGERPGAASSAGTPDTVVTGSLTKFLGLGSVRIGWLIGPESFIDRAASISVYLSDVAGPSRTLARRALGSRRLSEQAAERCRQNHELLAGFVADRPGLVGPVPEGASYALCSHTADDVDGDELASAAWSEGVLVVPGRFFGAPDAVRIALGHDPDRSAAALEALGGVLDSL